MCSIVWAQHYCSLLEPCSFIATKRPAIQRTRHFCALSFLPVTDKSKSILSDKNFTITLANIPRKRGRTYLPGSAVPHMRPFTKIQNHFVWKRIIVQLTIAKGADHPTGKQSLKITRKMGRFMAPVHDVNIWLYYCILIIFAAREKKGPVAHAPPAEPSQLTYPKSHRFRFLTELFTAR